ncbi:hypothetical protein [Streptomyces griseomycini]|uniref:ATP-binding protein n=1 Tax=Streptomyces griseomycini TaxID=66895 RepID=A0A7W7V9A9_9ACTN|nr:hypothetical protein [Streptomyces griseomycini]GGQ30617.1 hypothetical protein GCM10010266_62310 [Streptomyces griseomycini]GGR50301.1 hypothetical protein GCM10015536_64910 [Streptomyces griseomycini]
MPGRARVRGPVGRLRAPDTDSESGRGLLLVTALAADWGVTDRRPGPGKTVWAVVGTARGSRPGVLRQEPSGPRSPARRGASRA